MPASPHETLDDRTLVALFILERWPDMLEELTPEELERLKDAHLQTTAFALYRLKWHARILGRTLPEAYGLLFIRDRILPRLLGQRRAPGDHSGDSHHDG